MTLERKVIELPVAPRERLSSLLFSGCEFSACGLNDERKEFEYLILGWSILVFGFVRWPNVL